MSPHPPQPTFFPYTTLFRSQQRRALQVGVRWSLLRRHAERALERVTDGGHGGGRISSRQAHQCEIRLGIPSGAMTGQQGLLDRKSTRLNSSHGYISYAVFCLNEPPPTATYLLSLHDALPISAAARAAGRCSVVAPSTARGEGARARHGWRPRRRPHLLAPGAPVRDPVGDPIRRDDWPAGPPRSEEHTSELQSRLHLVCRLLLE